jgi:hypothetical protein
LLLLLPLLSCAKIGKSRLSNSVIALAPVTA